MFRRRTTINNDTSSNVVLSKASKDLLQKHRLLDDEKLRLKQSEEETEIDNDERLEQLIDIRRTQIAKDVGRKITIVSREKKLTDNIVKFVENDDE